MSNINNGFTNGHKFNTPDEGIHLWSDPSTLVSTTCSKLDQQHPSHPFINPDNSPNLHNEQHQLFDTSSARKSLSSTSYTYLPGNTSSLRESGIQAGKTSGSLVELFSWRNRPSNDVEASTPLTAECHDIDLEEGSHPYVSTNILPSSIRYWKTGPKYLNGQPPHEDNPNRHSRISQKDVDILCDGRTSHTSSQFRMVGAHGRELELTTMRSNSHQQNGTLSLSEPPSSPERGLPGDTTAPIEKKDGDWTSRHERRRKSSRLQGPKYKDHRFRRPRIKPRLKKWDPQNPDGPNLLHPFSNPVCLEKIQRKLPWYTTTLEAGGGPWLNLRGWDAPYKYSLISEFRIRWKTLGDRWLLLLRLTGVSLMILLLLLVNVVGVGKFYGNSGGVDRIWDWFHEITTPINTYISTNESAFTGLMFTASFLMDMCFLWIFFQWIVIGDSTRLPLGYAMMYGIRAVQRGYCLLPYPNGYIWGAPKFGNVNWPSLVVPYQPSDDFFFSGHIGFGILATVEHFYLCNWWGLGFSIFVTVFQAFWMCCTRGHYMIDMFTGAVVASWCHLIAQIISRPIDQWLSLPPRPYLKLAQSFLVKDVSTAILLLNSHDSTVSPEGTPILYDSPSATHASPTEYRPSLDSPNDEDQLVASKDPSDHLVMEVDQHMECDPIHGSSFNIPIQPSSPDLSLSSSPDWEYFHTSLSNSKRHHRLNQRSW